MRKAKKPAATILYVPTILDRTGQRHIIPGKDSAAYCGAVGSQHFPHDHKAADLCPRCVQKYMRLILDIRLGDLGL